MELSATRIKSCQSSTVSKWGVNSILVPSFFVSFDKHQSPWVETDSPWLSKSQIHQLSMPTLLAFWQWCWGPSHAVRHPTWRASCQTPLWWCTLTCYGGQGSDKALDPQNKAKPRKQRKFCLSKSYRLKSAFISSGLPLKSRIVQSFPNSSASTFPVWFWSKRLKMAVKPSNGLLG